MDEFGCDYECKTVGEGINKYNIPDDWCAEFDAYDGVYPIIVIQVDQIRKASAMMDLKLRMIENNWMLQQSDYVVTYITHSWGGAAQFAEKARRQRKIVINMK